MKAVWSYLALLLCWIAEINGTVPRGPSKRRPNVLFLMADDLRPELGCYSGDDAPTPVGPVMRTPHIDRLASRSLLLQRAYVQQAVCNPSRSSMLTSRRPDTTRVYSSQQYFRIAGGNFSTIPQYFKNQGYNSLGLGKIFHLSHAASGDNDAISWSEPVYQAPNFKHWKQVFRSWSAVSAKQRRHRPLPDDQLTSEAIRTLRRVAAAAKDGSQPFFLAVGFYKPHAPLHVPAEILDQYPLSKIQLPDDPYAPVDMPRVAWFVGSNFFKYNDVVNLNVTTEMNGTHPLPDWKAKEIRRAYYASVTYIDGLIGDILKELQALGLEDDTIISFTADHGCHLGEDRLWSKQTNFELATRVPFMIRVPGRTDGGSVSYRITEMVDLFPTLVEAAGLPHLPLCPVGTSEDTFLCTEGQSIMPLVEAANNKDWKRTAFSQFPRVFGDDRLDVMGYSVRTDHYRYTEWPMFFNQTPDWTRLLGVELYDHRVDPQERQNREQDPEYSNTKQELSNTLRRGWRTQIHSYSP